MFIWNLKKISSLLGLLIIEQGRQTIAHRQIMSHTVCFCKALKLRVVCIFLKGYKKKEKMKNMKQRLWPTKPKIFTIWLLTEKVCQPFSRISAS